MNAPAPPPEHSPEVQAALERLSRGMQDIAARIVENERRAKEEQESAHARILENEHLAKEEQERPPPLERTKK